MTALLEQQDVLSLRTGGKKHQKTVHDFRHDSSNGTLVLCQGCRMHNGMTMAPLLSHTE